MAAIRCEGMENENQNHLDQTATRRTKGLSPIMIAGLLAIVVAVSVIYLLAGGSGQSGAPVVQAPVTAPVTPQR